jgi:uncharacterized protein
LGDENLALHDHYVSALGQFCKLLLNEEHYIRAAELRARYNIKTPDALHLAAAQLHGCDQLWTNDDRLVTVSHGLALNITD